MKRYIYIYKMTLLLFLSFNFACSSDDEITSSDRPDSLDEVPRISAENLKTRIDNGEQIVVVDVRSTKEFDEGHIPNSINVPWGETTARLAEFPKDKDIVFYCT